MAAEPSIRSKDLVIVGVSERSVGAALRERLFAEEPDPATLLDRLVAAGTADAMAIVTCERIELLTLAEDGEAAALRLRGLLAEATGVPAEALDAEGFRHTGPAALRHLFAVTASLDSRAVGEPQILGQIKACHRRATAAGRVGPALEAILQAGYATARRIHSETPLAEQPVSIAAAALAVARDLHGDLAARRALLIGLGEMGEFMAGELLAAGVADLVVTHPSLDRAESVAGRLGCHFRPWAELAPALAAADIVVSAMGTGRFTVTAGLAAAALKARRREPIFFIDTAVPGDIEPAVGDLSDAFLYDLEDLERFALRGRATREAATAAAWQVLEEDLAAFRRQQSERVSGPAVAALRRHFEALREEVLGAGRLDAEQATRRLIERLLHDPSEVLRDAAGDGSLEQALQRLFRLDIDAAKHRKGPDEETET